MNALDFCDKEEIILFRQSDMSAEIFADAWLFITDINTNMFQCWASVSDAVPTLNNSWVSILLQMQ